MDNKIKVLVVEDEIIIALDIKRVLKKLGYAVCSIESDFNGALESFKKYDPDILLFDVNLGKNKKDGIDIAKEIRKISSTPIIFLTAYTDFNTLLRASEILYTDFISKPFNDSQVKSTLSLLVLKIYQDLKKD